MSEPSRTPWAVVAPTVALLFVACLIGNFIGSCITRSDAKTAVPQVECTCRQVNQ